jgi:hypothetical protein
MWVFIIAAQGYIGVCRRTLWPNPVLLMSVDALLKLRADVEAALIVGPKSWRVSCFDLAPRSALEQKLEQAR